MPQLPAAAKPKAAPPKSTPPLTIADLPEAERAKVSRLVERLVTLGKEHQQTIDNLSVAEANFTKDIDQQKSRNEADIKRLTAVITAIDEQRATAFNMLAQYQERVEQLVAMIKRIEADSITGDRKVALLANVKQLEDIVENQKSMIIGFQKDRASTDKAHKQELVLAQENVKRSEAEVRKKQDLLLKTEKRCNAIEMACARLTKQITEMTRRDSFKQAEIDAFKRLLTERTENAAVSLAAPITLEPSPLTALPRYEQPTTSAGEKEPFSLSGASSIASATGIQKGVGITASEPAPSGVYTVPFPPSPPRSDTASPKRKLTSALHISRGELHQTDAQKSSLALDSLSNTLKFPFTASAVGKNPAASSSSDPIVLTAASSGSLIAAEASSGPSPRKKALTTYIGNRNSSAAKYNGPVQTTAETSDIGKSGNLNVQRKQDDRDANPDTPPRSTQSSKSVQTSVVKNIDKPIAAEKPTRKQQTMTAERLTEKKNTRPTTRSTIIKQSATIQPHPSISEKDSVAVSSMVSEEKEVAKKTEKQSGVIPQRLTRATGSEVPVPKAQRSSQKKNADKSSIKSVTSPRPKLKVLLGENKMYDPALLDVLFAIDH